MLIAKENQNIIIAGLLLFILTFLSYGTSLSNGFLIDDNVLILDNPSIKSYAHFGRIFLSPFLEHYYRPLVFISFALDYSIWGNNPFGFHFTNVLFHFANSFLLYFFLRSIWKKRIFPLLAAIAFAVHPVNSITVNFISDRGQLLMCFFALLALISLLKIYGKKSVLYLAFFLALYSASLLSRENAVLFPFYAALSLSVVSPKNLSGKAVLAIISALLISLVYIMIRFFHFDLSFLIFPEERPMFTLVTLYTFFYMCILYISFIFIPYKLYMIRLINPPEIHGIEIYAIGFFVLSIALILYLLRKRQIALFGIGWFAAGLVPLYTFMFYRPHMGLIMQDNQMYFGYIGIFILAGLLYEVIEKRSHKYLARTMLFLLIIACLVKTNENNHLWQTQETYCEYWASGVPSCDIAAVNLANEYYNGKKYSKALKLYLKSLRGTSDDYEIYLNMGNIYSVYGKNEKAEKCLRNALKLNPSSWEAYNNLGAFQMKNRNYKAAKSSIQKVLDLRPRCKEAYLNLGLIYLYEGNKEKAREVWRLGQSLDPFDRRFKDCLEKSTQVMQ